MVHPKQTERTDRQFLLNLFEFENADKKNCHESAWVCWILGQQTTTAALVLQLPCRSLVVTQAAGQVGKTYTQASLQRGGVGNNREEERERQSHGHYIVTSFELGSKPCRVKRLGRGRFEGLQLFSFWRVEFCWKFSFLFCPKDTHHASSSDSQADMTHATPATQNIRFDPGTLTYWMPEFVRCDSRLSVAHYEELKIPMPCALSERRTNYTEKMFHKTRKKLGRIFFIPAKRNHDYRLKNTKRHNKKC